MYFVKRQLSRTTRDVLYRSIRQYRVDLFAAVREVLREHSRDVNEAPRTFKLPVFCKVRPVEHNVGFAYGETNRQFVTLPRLPFPIMLTENAELSGSRRE